ncbi:MAG: DUF4397 domain-containing protein [Bacteroidota bacterium]|nr:DUF4397 domain-containing protein [Bacteroidota bacterium]MDP4206579.1 DUF4397 domain-containing protein [Bacteroidota bacterium]
MKKIDIYRFLLILICISSFFACKENTLQTEERITDSPSGMAKVKVFNYSPTAPNFNIFNGVAKLVGAATSTNDTVDIGIPYKKFFPDGSGVYNLVAPGNFSADLIVPKSSAVQPNAKILSQNISLVANKAYSLYVTDTLTRTSIVVVEDDLTPVEIGKSGIRFANMMLGTDLTELKLSTTLTDANGNTSTVMVPVQPVIFKQVSPFVVVSSGNFVATVSAVNKNATDLKLSFSAVSGKKYTVYIRGYKAQTNAEIGTTVNY